MYCPLWTKTNYSFLEGASHPDEIVEMAHELGLPALGITDRNGVYGMARSHIAAKACHLKLLVGAELDIVTGHRIVLFAQNRRGYGRLCQLITRGKRRVAKGEFQLFWDDVYAHAGDMMLLCGPNSPLSRNQPDNKIMHSLREAYAGKIFAMVTRHKQATDKPNERFMREAAAKLSLPTVAATEVLYHHKSRARLQHVLTAIRHNVKLSEAGTKLTANAEHYLRPPEGFARLFGDVPDDVARTLDIANACTFSLDHIRYRYPLENMPSGMTSSAWLRKLTLDGAKKRYGAVIPDAVMNQINKELSLVDELDYGGYFLTMYEIVKYCRENNILCQGRGSAANSIVCYCLHVTAVDPMQMDLLFERFISRERAEPPDIDLDIEHEKREQVIQYVYEKYGRQKSAMVANVVRYRARSAIREVGKALGVSSALLDRTAKLMHHYSHADDAAAQTLGVDMENPKLQLLFEYAGQISDFPRHLSIHPGGFLLGDRPVHDLVPIENASMPGRTVIQWDKEDLEELGLFKVDLLGLGALTVIHRCFDLIAQHWQEEVTLRNIPPGDTDTYDMICTADTVGLFQIESRAQMSMLPRLLPRHFYDLVVEISLVRPGPITGGMVHPYLRRRKGLEEVTYPHECLKPVLQKTLGVPLFQEQVMKLAVVAADYTPGEADQLRRDMAAWRRSGRIEKHRERLTSRMVAKGIPQEFAQRVFEQIRGFGEYGFPESHAASFALIAYATAYLRRHYMAAYLCAILNAQPMGFYSPSTLIHDAIRHGIEVRPVDINESAWDCTLEPAKNVDTDTDNKTRTSFAVRMGLRYVHGLSEHKHGTPILQTRAQADFASVSDFCYRTGLDQKALTALSKAGALGGVEKNRRNALWQVRAYCKQDKIALGKKQTSQASFRQLSAAESVQWDYRAGGHSSQMHPLAPFRQILAGQSLPTAAVVNKMRDGRRCDYAGMVICRQRPGTAAGVTFMTLEDETGFVNLVIWKDVFAKFSIVAKTSSFLGVSGKLQKQEGITHLIAEKLWRPDLAATEVRSRDFH